MTGIEERRRYSFDPFATKLQKEMGIQHHVPAALSPRKTGFQLHIRLWWAWWPFWTARKNSPKMGFDHRTVQPVTSRYTN